MVAEIRTRCRPLREEVVETSAPRLENDLYIVMSGLEALSACEWAPIRLTILLSERASGSNRLRSIRL